VNDEVVFMALNYTLLNHIGEIIVDKLMPAKHRPVNYLIKA